MAGFPLQPGLSLNLQGYEYIYFCCINQKNIDIINLILKIQSRNINIELESFAKK